MLRVWSTEKLRRAACGVEVSTGDEVILIWAKSVIFEAIKLRFLAYEMDNQNIFAFWLKKWQKYLVVWNIFCTFASLIKNKARTTFERHKQHLIINHFKN